MSTTAFRRARLGAAAGLTMLALAAPASAETGDAASLSVLQGLPGLTVDVWVNGERTVDGVEPASLAGPLELPAGSYSVAITAADGAPTASFFTNDTTAASAGEGRLTVRHTAAATAVDVLAGGGLKRPRARMEGAHASP